MTGMKTSKCSFVINVVYRKRINPGFNVKGGVKKILMAEKKKRSEINVIFTGNSRIREINLKYLKKNYATDVISFPLLKDKGGFYGGDIYISADKAAENAREYGVSLKNELARLVAHGVLHVLDYDHIKRRDERIMKPKEDRYMKFFTAGKT
jgi:probable rRNA maturation factor